MNLDATEPILNILYYGQMLGVFIGGLMFLFGIFMFLYSFKNPHKKRLAFVTTVFGPILFMFSLYGPVFGYHYMIDKLLPESELAELKQFEPAVKHVGSSIYEAIQLIVYPLLVIVFLIALGTLHHATRIPGRKRISYGIFIGIPVLYILMETGPSIVRLLTS